MKRAAALAAEVDEGTILSDPDLLAKLLSEVKILSATVKLLNDKVEGWRTHTGSTGYFLQVATEDLTRSVATLQERIEALK